MQVGSLSRYPVKSLLGEHLDEIAIDDGGVDRDRGLAFVDAGTGLVASAKHPRLWRHLLLSTAAVVDGQVRVSSPEGWTLDADDPDLAARFSRTLGRPVRLVSERPPEATVERPDPVDVIAEGVEAEVPAATLEIGQGTPGGNFVDYAPVHVITTSTLEHVGTDAARYRPNIVLDTPDGTPYAENDWVGRRIEVGGVVLEVVLPTPRCAVPTLRHGDLPRDPHAVRALLEGNRVDVPGFGVLPCAGVYARVHSAGSVRVGDAATLS